MNSRKFFAIFFVVCMLSTDFMIPAVLAGHHHKGNHGIELLLAAGILAKLLRKKGGGGGHHHHHHGHHHGHHHHGHHHHGHHHHGSGSRNVEVVHVAPPMGGYSGPYHTAQSSYGGAQAATSSFSASIEYPFSPSASQPMGMHQPMPLPYGGPTSAASFIGYDPQPVQVYPPVPMPGPEQGAPMHI